MTNPSEPGPDAQWGQPASFNPIPTGPRPYPAHDQPGPYASGGPEAGQTRPTAPTSDGSRSRIWRIVLGALVAVFAGVYVIRGLTLLAMSFVRGENVPDGPAFAFGYLLPPLALLALGIFLTRRGLTINRVNRQPPAPLR